MPIERHEITDHAAWLQTRQRYVGASEVAVICGEAGYGSAAELFAVKRGLRPPLMDDSVLRRGKWGEAACVQAIADTFPEWRVVRAQIHLLDTDRRLAATPDAFVIIPHREGTGVCECKVVSRSIFRQRWLDDPSDSITDGAATPPAAFYLQTVANMMLAEMQWGIIAVLINGEYSWDFRIFDVERNPVIESRIEYNVARFVREHLDVNVMPAFEPARDDALVRALYPKDDGTEIDLTTDNRALWLVEDWIETQAALKRLNAQERSIKTELQAKLGEHTYGRLADGRVLSWKMQQRKGYSVEPTSYRVLRLMSHRSAE